MDFYEKWIINNYKLFTDEILQVFLQTGDLSQDGYNQIKDKIKAEKQIEEQNKNTTDEPDNQADNQ
ncbi:hypothetical protein FD06_GL000271 [Apilactobacillus ozensis DSM 23829 = JCM 17196]|uniref:Uncharacterized protein n=1 Tax=Apilactobacillus ozensis DSM 23829 = JCM 17196 TaxID=1423781 RepID=A0A0R2B2Q2_9LACO|nr:hypothetical protein [Apilactobacillus ozensis]KRM69212.1 hypothetical protein FD06_GL000271 [Apilactobacillus ozensis DSM 23829 = JCM 17196]